jgi:hypothetical protein
MNEIKDQPLENRFQQGRTAVHALLESACEMVDIDYERSLLHAKTYTHLCDTYQQHLKILQHAETTQLVDMTPEAIAEHLELFRTSQKACQIVADEQDAGVFRLDYWNLKGKALRIVTRCRTAFHRIIPELYVTHGDNFYNDLSRLLDNLSNKHSTVEAYVRLVELYRKTIAEEEPYTTARFYISAPGEKVRRLLSCLAILSNNARSIKT